MTKTLSNLDLALTLLGILSMLYTITYIVNTIANYYYLLSTLSHKTISVQRYIINVWVCNQFPYHLQCNINNLKQNTSINTVFDNG